MDKFQRLENATEQVEAYINHEMYPEAISLCNHVERYCWDGIRGCESFQKALEGVRGNGEKLKQSVDEYSGGMRDELGQSLVVFFMNIAKRMIAISKNGDEDTIYQLILVLRRTLVRVQEQRLRAERLKREREIENDTGYVYRSR